MKLSKVALVVFFPILVVTSSITKCMKNLPMKNSRWNIFSIVDKKNKKKKPCKPTSYLSCFFTNDSKYKSDINIKKNKPGTLTLGNDFKFLPGVFLGAWIKNWDQKSKSWEDFFQSALQDRFCAVSSKLRKAKGVEMFLKNTKFKRHASKEMLDLKNELEWLENFRKENACEVSTTISE